jgi:hypothetical protein
MGKFFGRLKPAEQAALTAHVRAEYDDLVQKQPASYAARHAQADPAGWQDTLRELISGDAERVVEILLKARRAGKPQEEPRK